MTSPIGHVPMTRINTTKKSGKFNLEHVFSNEEEYAWDMEPDLQNFFEMYCRKHIPDNDLRERTKQYPAPSNMKVVLTLDAAMKRLLEEEKAGAAVDLDNDLETIQTCLQNVMGPLGVAWNSIELIKIGAMFTRARFRIYSIRS